MFIKRYIGRKFFGRDFFIPVQHNNPLRKTTVHILQKVLCLLTVRARVTDTQT